MTGRLNLAINGHVVGTLAVLSLPIGPAILWVSALDFLFHLTLVSRFFVLGDERQRAAPRQRDMARASRESRYKTGIFPTPWGTPDLAINHEEPENTRPLACRKRETNA